MLYYILVIDKGGYWWLDYDNEVECDDWLEVLADLFEDCEFIKV